MFLTDTDLERLTGRRQPRAQRRWLSEHAWRFTTNRLGHPVVALAEFQRKMVGGTVGPQQPNFEYLNGPPSHT